MNENDLRVIKTKKNIYDSLLECFSKYPVKKITVNKITEHARINRSTFYKYYLDKYDLIEKFIDEVLENFKKNINSDFINASKKEIYDSKYHEYFNHILYFFKSNSYIYKVLWNTRLERNIYNEMLKILQQDIYNINSQDTTFDETKSNYATLYSFLFASNCMTTIRWWIESCPEMSVDDIGLLMKSNMENGFFQTYRSLIDNK